MWTYCEILQRTEVTEQCSSHFDRDTLMRPNYSIVTSSVWGNLVALGERLQNSEQFDAAPIVFRELSIKGAYVCGAEAAERMLQVVATAGVRSHLTSIPFERIPEIVKIYTDDKFQGRIVVDVS
jgi:D-arabinose 1-dehydrogenase-like Zn-dependent alcohol dehydrogenase